MEFPPTKNKRPMETSKIASLLENTFHGTAWHGPSVMEVLENVSPQMASRRIANSHNIIELIGHMTTWRNFVTKRLNGDSLYEVSDAENFPTVLEWDQTVRQLKESQSNLLTALKAFPETKLFTTVPT